MQRRAKARSIRSVGYGQNDEASPIGTRFRKDGVAVLAQGTAVSPSKTPLGTHEFEVGTSICQGDSGGPAISETDRRRHRRRLARRRLRRRLRAHLHDDRGLRAALHGRVRARRGATPTDEAGDVGDVDDEHGSDDRVGRRHRRRRALHAGGLRRSRRATSGGGSASRRAPRARRRCRRRAARACAAVRGSSRSRSCYARSGCGSSACGFATSGVFDDAHGPARRRSRPSRDRRARTTTHPRSLAPRPVTVLFGGDGTGKTTLLTALALTRPGHALPPSPTRSPAGCARQASRAVCAAVRAPPPSGCSARTIRSGRIRSSSRARARCSTARSTGARRRPAPRAGALRSTRAERRRASCSSASRAHAGSRAPRTCCRRRSAQSSATTCGTPGVVRRSDARRPHARDEAGSLVRGVARALGGAACRVHSPRARSRHRAA